MSASQIMGTITIGGIQLENAYMRAELTRLRAVVDRLPHTKDGVPVLPGMMVYPPCGHDEYIPRTFTPVEVNRVSCWKGSCHSEYYGENDYHESNPTKYDVEQCYSTREAAEAAMKETKS